MNKLKVFLLFLGDIIALYAALFITLIIRYRDSFYYEFINAHAAPFTFLFIVWLIVFYAAGLYDLRRLRNNLEVLKVLGACIIINAFLAIFLFYAIPVFGIAPKTNLLICLIIFAVIEIIWRQTFNRTTSSGEAPNRVILVGTGSTAEEVARGVMESPQLGYTIVERITEQAAASAPRSLEESVRNNNANIVVIPGHLKRETKLTIALYELFGQGIVITDLANFYEQIMRKVPLADLEETWFLENIEGTARFYEPLKRAAEFIEAVVIGIILLPFEILIALGVKLTSRGPIIYKQMRVGQNGKDFMLYKFRTMRSDAEKNGAQWATQNDTRITPFGRFLRKTHLDELPQLMNIARGEISFVGPRPERPEFVGKLKEQVPYYEVRLLVKPGLTGWAQINHRADLSIEDVKQKLQYDIYYLKNRSIVLDLAIVLKTAKSLFVNPE